MSNNRKRHKILNALYNDGIKEIEDMTGLSSMDLLKEIDIEDIDCKSLLQEFRENGYVNEVKGRYYITTTGVCAFKDKTYLNKMWYRSWTNWLSIVAIVISIIALFRS